MLELAVVVFVPTPMVSPDATVVGFPGGGGVLSLPTPTVGGDRANYGDPKSARVVRSISYQSWLVAILDRCYLPASTS